MATPIYLFDTNAIIEAVRTGVWKGLAGALNLQTVEECADESRRGDRLSTGYVVVSEADLERFAMIHAVSDLEVANVLLMERAEALHDGERDLFAHALALAEEEVWVVCSPDLASVKFAVAAGIGDRLISLEEAMKAVGAKAKPELRGNFTSAWLKAERANALLGL